MSTAIITRAAMRAQLEALAHEQRRDLCGHCGGRPNRPCARCLTQRRRIVELYDDYRPLAVIAADVGLPTWRVEQILDEQRQSEHVDERLVNADLLRPELGDLVDVILAGPRPPAGQGWQFDRERQWQLWVRLTLGLVGWNMRSVTSVLSGTHIPNLVVRQKLEAARAAHLAASGQPLTSTMLSQRTGIGSGDGTYFDRVIGARPSSINRKNGRAYGGQLLKAISIEYATRIAEVIGVAHHEIPGL